jgi:FkbM family methyltransferase
MAFARKKTALAPADPSEIVTTIYVALLGREPDEQGLLNFVELYKSDGLQKVLEEIGGSEEMRKHVSATNYREHWSLSQFREVEILLSLMTSTVAPSKIIVDVGAAGVHLSNSIDLISSIGWKGILVEANPEDAALLAEAVKDIDATVLNYAVSDSEGEATFFLGRHPHFSSLKPEMTSFWGPIEGEVTVTKRRLPNILKDENVPEVFGVLSLDIEGVEFEVINDLLDNSNYRPQWMIIEWGEKLYEATLSDERLTEKIRHEYSIVGGTEANIFLQHRSVTQS